MIRPNVSRMPYAHAFGRLASLIVICGCLAGCWSILPDSLIPGNTLDAMIGMNLSVEEADALEERLESDPHDLSARTQLISYYSRKSWTDGPSARRQGWHVIWLTQNDPRNPFLRYQATIDPDRNPGAYARIKAIWLDHLDQEPRDTGLLGNAAGSLDRGPDRDLAVSFLERAQAIDPGNFMWASSLGSLRWRMAQEGRDRPDPVLAAAALADYERAQDLNRHGFRFSNLNTVMQAAFAAGEFDKARAYAAEALAGGGMPFNLEPECRANVVLGRIMLAEGDSAAAGDYLIAAGRVAAWPSLTPLLLWRADMQLADELLARGERQAVLEYLKLCALHWEDDRLPEWADEIRAGGIPDLGRPLSW